MYYVHQDIKAMLIVVLSAIDSNWKQSKYPSKEEMLNKLWYIYTLGYFMTIKINELQLHGAIIISFKKLITSVI